MAFFEISLLNGMNAALLEEKALFDRTLGDNVVSHWSISKSPAQNHVTQWPTCAGALQHLLKLDVLLPELIVNECSWPMSAGERTRWIASSFDIQAVKEAEEVLERRLCSRALKP